MNRKSVKEERLSDSKPQGGSERGKEQELTDFSRLPMTLTADQIASILSISRTAAYKLMHTKGFPTIKFGYRMVVHRDRFLNWIDVHMGA